MSKKKRAPKAKVLPRAKPITGAEAKALIKKAWETGSAAPLIILK